MKQDDYRNRIKAAVKKISSLAELVPTDFILTNHMAQRQRQRVERARDRISKLPALASGN